MVNKEEKRVVYPKKPVYLTLLVVGVVLIGAIAVVAKLKFNGLFDYRNSKLQNTLGEQKDGASSIFSFVTGLPDGWYTAINDDSTCHTIYIFYRGKYNDDLKKYIKQEVYKGTGPSEITDLDTYNINSPHVIDVGSQGMLNKNTLYVKSRADNVYVVEIHSTPKGADAYDKGLKTCSEIKPTVQHIVKSLL